MLIGLVGKPSCGKSTFFKAATLSEVEIASYPFTTIKPNHGVGYVKIDCVDKEFNVKCQPKHGFCINGQRFIPVELMDVAGLIKGASKGKGLGNQFLDELRQADAFIHIVDISGETDAEGKVTKGYNPNQDIEMLENELDLWYLGILKKVWNTFVRQVQSSKENFAKAVAKQFSGLKVTEDDVKEVVQRLGFNTSNAAKWTDEQLMNFAHELRRLTKPMIVAANKIDKQTSARNLEELKKTYPELIIIPCSSDSELALREAAKAELIEYVPGEKSFKIKEKNKQKLSEKQKQALEAIKKNVLGVYENTGVQQILNTAVFDLLKYIAVFPVEDAAHLKDSQGNILPDCYLLPDGSTAQDLAYAIHTDIGKNFIKAIDAKTKRVLGKEHVLKNRDVIEIVAK